MIDRAPFYGCWAALLAVVAFTILDGYGMLRHGARLVDALLDLMIMQAPRAAVTFAVASVGWLLLHLARRRPGWR